LDRAPYLTLLRKGDYSLSYLVESERYDWDDAYFMYLHSGEINKKTGPGTVTRNSMAYWKKAELL